MQNPYAITFGIIPEKYIPRIEQRETIINDFNYDPAPTKAYVIIGVRGSGKTVLLTEISSRIGQDWIRIDLSSHEDLLRSLTSQLYAHRSANGLFVKARFDFSFMGLGVQVESSVPAYDYQTAISMMLGVIAKDGKRVLVSIDEVARSADLTKFTSVFQILARQGLPIFLVMAGTPENVFGLMDEKKSTFLYRTPRIQMTPLNHTMIVSDYRKNLQVNEDTARQMAVLTLGYPFAYQALGHICWGKHININSPDFQDILTEYDYYLQEFSYEKIWDEMSLCDKEILKAMASLPEQVIQAKSIREVMQIDTKKYSVYRDRLIKKGIIRAESYGIVTFCLPRFKEFVKNKP